MLDNQSGSSREDLLSLVTQTREQAEQPEPEERPTGGTDESEEYEADDSTEYEEDDAEEADASEYEESEDGHEESEDEAEEPQRYRVKVDGKEFEVDRDELISGYQRDADYRKKTTEVAEQRKALEAKEAEVAQKVQELESFIEQTDQNIDWDELRDTDPSEYLRQKDLQEKRIAAKDKAKGELTQKNQEQMQQRVQEESQKLREVMGPEWTDAKIAKDLELANKYLETMGVSQEEANSIVDHRQWKMIFDAAQYQRLMANKSKVSKEVKKAPKSVKPGQRKAPSERAAQEAREKLKKADKRNAPQALADLLTSRRGK